MPEVLADRGKVRQIILNLLSNAIKFTPDNGRIEIKTIKKDNTCQVSISDSGIGIRSEDLGRIFEPFMQIDNPITRAEGGTGLGLMICKRLVELHRGQIWVESDLDKGSTFFFTILLSDEATEIQQDL